MYCVVGSIIILTHRTVTSSAISDAEERIMAGRCGNLHYYTNVEGSNICRLLNFVRVTAWLLSVLAAERVYGA